MDLIRRRGNGIGEGRLRHRKYSGKKNCGKGRAEHGAFLIPGFTRKAGPRRDRCKRQQIREFGCADRHLGAYEEDHRVPLGLGGAA